MKSNQQVWGSHLAVGPAEQNVLFCAGRDVQAVEMADAVLLPFDIWTNQAHSIMLHEQGILEKEALHKILEGLAALQEQVNQGEFVLDPQKEDVHINVEAFVTEKQGAAVGGMMHTGRSRNDQTSCDMRLYLRQACVELQHGLIDLVEALLKHAKDHVGSVMPGFTHYQPGMITSWAHWVCSYAQALLRDVNRIEASLTLVQRNPLGAAASFGTSWNLNRARTAELLGFDRVETNTLDCITSRWENEAQLAQTYSFLMNHLSIMAQDLIFLSLPYIRMIQIDESMVTGSSIMPQKKNPDFAEVIKSKASLVQGAVVSLMGIQKGGLSGYNRDTQLTKYLIMDVIRECQEAPEIMKAVIQTLKPQPQMMKALCDQGFMNAVDIADLIARECQLSFREGYHIAASAVQFAEKAGVESLDKASVEQALQEAGVESYLSEESLQKLSDPTFIVEQRSHEGAPSAASVMAHIEEMEGSLEVSKQELHALEQRLQKAKVSCDQYREQH